MDRDATKNSRDRVEGTSQIVEIINDVGFDLPLDQKIPPADGLDLVEEPIPSHATHTFRLFPACSELTPTTRRTFCLHHTCSVHPLHHSLLIPIFLRTRPFTPIPLIQQLLNMLIQPISPKHPLVHFPRPINNPPTTLLPTRTLKRLGHIPLGTGIKKRQGIAPFQMPPLHHSYLHFLHVEDEGGLTGVVYVDDVAV